jgi:predicted Ser/Thr protein kinase
MIEKKNRLAAVNNYLKKINSFKNSEVTTLNKGHNNECFLIRINDMKYVLKRVRTDTITESNLKNEYIVLKFLKTQDITFVPQPVLYDDNERIIIVTYVGKMDSSLKDLKDEQVERLIFNLKEISLIDHKEFDEFCKNSGYKINKPETPLASLKKYGVERFEYVRKNCPDHNIIEWIVPKLEKNIESIKNSKFNNSNIILVHGDLGSNIRIDENDVWIIDWELARLSFENTPAYSFIHGGLSEEQKEFYLKAYAKQFNLSKKELKIKILFDEEIIMVNDVIWAAMRYSTSIKLGKPDWKKYYDLTRERIKKFECKFLYK